MKRLLVLALALAACANDSDPAHPEHAPYVPPSAQPLACVPNLDGQIDSSELDAFFGVTEQLLVSTADRTVDVAGTPQMDGTIHWDFTGDYADDRTISLGAVPLGDQWFAGSFPGGQFVLPFDAGATIMAVYAKDDATVYLLGEASTDENPADGQTLLPYQTPVHAFELPLAPGKQWVSVGEVMNGTIKGLPYAGKDTYQFSVDGVGQLSLPDLVFSQAMRVRATVTVEPAAGVATQVKQVSFLSECFGEVARASSHPGETNDDFTTAAEVRRLGF